MLLSLIKKTSHIPTLYLNSHELILRDANSTSHRLTYANLTELTDILKDTLDDQIKIKYRILFGADICRLFMISAQQKYDEKLIQAVAQQKFKSLFPLQDVNSYFFQNNTAKFDTPVLIAAIPQQIHSVLLGFQQQLKVIQPLAVFIYNQHQLSNSKTMIVQEGSVETVFLQRDSLIQDCYQRPKSVHLWGDQSNTIVWDMNQYNQDLTDA